MRTATTALVVVFLALLALGAMSPDGFALAYPGYYETYLPLVNKPVPTPTPTPTPIPTATPTPTPTPQGCKGVVQALQNTSFETGGDPWWASGAPVRTNSRAFDGSWSVYLGGYNNALDGIGQDTNVPSWAESVTLALNEYMISIDSTTAKYDALGMGLYDNSLGSYIFTMYTWNTYGRNNWYGSEYTYQNIEPYRGHPVSVIAAGITDSSLPTAWYVDNIRLYFGCGVKATNADDSATPLPLSDEQDEMVKAMDMKMEQVRKGLKANWEAEGSLR